MCFWSKISGKRVDHKTAIGSFGCHHSILSLGKTREHFEDRFGQCSGAEVERKKEKGWCRGVSDILILSLWVSRLIAACYFQMRR